MRKFKALCMNLLCLYRQNNIDIVTDLVETEGMQPNMCFLHRSACLRQPAIILHKHTYDEYKTVVYSNCIVLYWIPHSHRKYFFPICW